MWGSASGNSFARLKSLLGSTKVDDSEGGVNLVNNPPKTGESGVINYAFDYGKLERYGGGAGKSPATNDAALSNLTISCDALNIPAILPGGVILTSVLWHVNLPISIIGNGSTLSGGDADGVVWYGYRTGANQNSYFEQLFVEDLIFVGSNNAGEGFTSSKSIGCRFSNLKALSSLGSGLVFRAAVGCKFDSIQGRLCGFSGVIFTFFTNSDGTTDVPSTGCVIDNMIADANGTDGAATALNAYGLLCDKNTDGLAGAYGNEFNGGFVQLNEFTGIRDFGDNVFNNIWVETNGQDAGTTQQYNFWDSGPLGSTVNGGRCQGAGVSRKYYIDGGVDQPVTRNVHFDGALQIDLQYEETISGTHTGAANAAILTDSSKAWKPSALIGKVITNTTDGSTATITANTAQAITGTLAGGIDNDWGVSDAYTIADSGPTRVVQELNDHSGAATQIHPPSFDQRTTTVGTKRKNTADGTVEWGVVEFDLDANTSGLNNYYYLFSMDDNTQSGVFDVAVFIDGAPPTPLGQITFHPATRTGVNQYVRFTTLYNERFSSSTGNSNAADTPVVRITSTGTVQYQHNDGSSAQQIVCRFIKKI